MGGCTGKGRGRGGSSNTYPYTWRSCERQGPRAADAAAQAGSDGVVVVVMLQVTGACRVHDGPLGTRVRARRAPGANLVLESIGGGAKVRTRCGVHVVLSSPSGQVTSRRVSQDGRRTGRCYAYGRVLASAPFARVVSPPDLTRSSRRPPLPFVGMPIEDSR